MDQKPDTAALLDSVIDKSVKLLEKTAIDAQPKVVNLLTTFEAWLIAKLSSPQQP